MSEVIKFIENIGILDGDFSVQILAFLYCLIVTIYIFASFRNERSIKLMTMPIWVISFYIIWSAALISAMFSSLFGFTVAVVVGSSVGIFLSIRFLEKFEVPLLVSKKYAKYLILACTVLAFFLEISLKPLFENNRFPGTLSHIGIFSLLLVMVVWQIGFTILIAKAIRKSKMRVGVLQTTQTN
jgi:hypothetical protein